MGVIFANYSIVDPTLQKSVSICKLSYVAAGLFGVLYFVIKAGRVRLLDAITLNILCLAALVGLVLVTSILSAEQQFFTILAATPVVLIFQSVRMVALVKSSYRRRQWLVRQND